MNYKSIIGAAMLLTLSAPLYAIPVGGSTHGDLISNPGTKITNELPVFTRQYSMFDAFSLSYVDVLAAVGTGGIFEGWNIATLTEANDFMNSAIVGSNQTCGADWCIDGWSDGDFGASWSAQYDYFAYVNGPVGDPAQLGLMEFDSTSGSVGLISDFATWAASNSPLGLNTIGNGINMLLWTDDLTANPLSQPIPAPEPGILALLSLGLLGMGVRRFKAKG